MSKRKKTAKPAGPEAILPTQDFRAKPWGDEEVAFKAGQISAPVPAEFAEKMRQDGKAAPRQKVAQQAPAEPVRPEQTASDKG